MTHAYDTTSAARSRRRRATFRHVRKHWTADAIGHGVMEPAIDAARAYDHVGYDYGHYADGDKSADVAKFASRRYEHGDALVWKELEASLARLHRLGIAQVRVLDAGCGPGTWTRRIADYASAIGMNLTIVGVDVSTTQLEIARHQNVTDDCTAAQRRTAMIEFQECDLSKTLPWTDRYFDLVLCNYTVLNHLSESALPAAIGELCRVSSGDVIATLRAIGSQPTVCIIGMERVRAYRHDNDDGELFFTLDDASRHTLPFKMYTAEALKSLFAPYAFIRDVRAIDIFAGRFSADDNWTAELLQELPERDLVLEQLAKLEEELCRQPGWIDHGTHVLIVAWPKPFLAEKSVRHLKAL